MQACALPHFLWRKTPRLLPDLKKRAWMQLEPPTRMHFCIYIFPCLKVCKKNAILSPQQNRLHGLALVPHPPKNPFCLLQACPKTRVHYPPHPPVRFTPRSEPLSYGSLPGRGIFDSTHFAPCSTQAPLHNPGRQEWTSGQPCQ